MKVKVVCNQGSCGSLVTFTVAGDTVRLPPVGVGGEEQWLSGDPARADQFRTASDLPLAEFAIGSLQCPRCGHGQSLDNVTLTDVLKANRHAKTVIIRADESAQPRPLRSAGPSTPAATVVVRQTE